MQYPKNLEKGYQIGVTAISSGLDSVVDLRRLESAIDHFHEVGYPIIETDNVRKNEKGRSSDGATRAKELMQLMNDPNIKVVIAASGGDFLIEMLPYINYEELKSNPKWIQGYSDATCLLYILTTNLDFATIYANNFSTFGMKNWHSSLMDNLNILEGKDFIQYSFDRFQDDFQDRITGLEEFVLEKDVNWINLYPSGEASDKELILRGRALGGCLDAILNIVGTRFDMTRNFIDRYQKDKILWFLESYDLGSEALIKGLWQLKEAGWFEHAAGFIFGRPAMFHSYTDTTYEEAVLSVLGDMNLPIVLDADIGHKPPQFTMINGAIVEVRSFLGKGSIIFERG